VIDGNGAVDVTLFAVDASEVEIRSGVVWTRSFFEGYDGAVEVALSLIEVAQIMSGGAMLRDEVEHLLIPNSGFVSAIHCVIEDAQVVKGVGVVRVIDEAAVKCLFGQVVVTEFEVAMS